MIYSIAKYLSLAVFKLFFTLEVKGAELIPARGPFILASNHASNLDPVVLGAACPRRIFFVAKEELFKNPLAGFFLKRLQARPIRRSGSDVAAIKTALNILKKHPLLVFPQGTRDAGFYDFKEGAGFLYKKTMLPVVAARIYGAHDALPRGSKIPKCCKIKVVFRRVEGLSAASSRADITVKIMEEIRKLD